MSYKETIALIAAKVPKNVVDFDVIRKRGVAPTQAFSDFLTHSEQGDWAESLVMTSLKDVKSPYVPIKYGKSEKIIAGDKNFKQFYSDYQDELDLIGKRPDILLFSPDVAEKGWLGDIGGKKWEDLSQIVPKAAAGLEVRSSAYLTGEFVTSKERPYLSFTPKVEDLFVVLKWINTYGVPHFYVQVFFDAIYVISFEEILNLITQCELKEKGIKTKKICGYKKGELSFMIEKNPKNQFKETLHIFLSNGHLISNFTDMPELIGVRRKLAGGRLLHYVSFQGGKADIDFRVLERLIRKER